jgi:hypothetical protein
MNRGIGTFALIAVLAAGTRMAVTPRASTAATTNERTASSAIKARQPEGTVCSEFASGQSGKNSSSRGDLGALIGQFLHGAAGQTVGETDVLPKDTRVLVATVPDPLHTLLNLPFDRTIDAIQQAAQDEGYTYDSSWLPWKAGTTDYSSLSDQSEERQEAVRRELCPGLILFRKKTGQYATGSYDDSYTQGLFVFLVGEKPTTGINRTQWDNTLAWIRLHTNKQSASRSLRILGPVFSGSVTSVALAVIELRQQKSDFSNVLLYSGTVSGCSSLQWLNDELHKPAAGIVRVADFVQNDALHIDRYFKYLSERGHSIGEVAIVSEDETAYGGLPDPRSGTVATCEPVYLSGTAPLHLYYPRNISALRSAYQEQSLFSSSTGDKSNATHSVLQPQASTSTHVDTDTVTTFSGPNSALAQEAQMYGIVDSLKTHGIRFVILRSSNTLDYLFLTRFLHRAYPDAFIVTMGADMLFGREIDSTEFRGVQALTSFPLLPRGQDWTRAKYSVARHAHRVFGSDGMEGTYHAARFLVTDPDAIAGEPVPYIHPPKPDIPDYRAPFWQARSSNTAEPSTWLSVVGRDGYWPVAVLTETSSKLASPPSTEATVSLPGQTGAAAVNLSQWKFSLSPAWKICCALAILAVCLHLYACVYGRRRENQSMFVQFVPLQGMRQFFLIGVGWAAVGSIILLMFICSEGINPYLEEMNSLWISILSVFAWVVVAGIVLDTVLRAFGEPDSLSIGALRAWAHRLLAAKDGEDSVGMRVFRACIWIAFPLLLLAAARWAGMMIFEPFNPQGNGVPTDYRAVHVTNGVSPMVSLLLLLCGFYGWFWHTLSGLALLGQGRPILPRKTHLAKSLARISDEMARSIEALAMPLPGIRQAWVYLFPIAIMVLPLYSLRRHGADSFDAILHSLENHAFSKTLHGLFALALYLLILECTQLLGAWLSLKRLLLALNRTPLRRTFSALQGLSMHSLWSLTGTTSRARYTIFSHQCESLFHLRNVLRSFDARDCGDDLIRAAINDACERGRMFVEERSGTADLAMVNDQDSRYIREVFCQCTEHILSDLILPEWSGETRSLDLLEGGDKPGPNQLLPLSDSEPIRFAEEFVCLIYVGYLQNLLARMRTMVLSMVGVVAGLAFSLAFYPFVPRPTIALSLLAVVAALGAVVALVYAGLARDTTLSNITNTEPGKVGLDFWVRFASFIGVPVLGMLVAQFPAITDFVTSWIEPSLNAAK